MIKATGNPNTFTNPPKAFYKHLFFRHIFDALNFSKSHSSQGNLKMLQLLTLGSEGQNKRWGHRNLTAENLYNLL